MAISPSTPAPDEADAESARAPVGGGDLAVELDPMQISAGLGDLASPGALAGELPRFMSELAGIAVGASDIEFAERDKRFADPSWRHNPFYRRVGQSYLAWAKMVERLADNPALSWERRARSKYLAQLLVAALAPTNTLPGNPGAIKRAFETGGVSLFRGMQNFWRDMATNHGMPSMVDRTPYTVGENLAATPGAVVHREEMFELVQFAPSTTRVRSRPLLMVPPQVNKHYFLDLAPGRSLVEYTVAQGIQFFSIVWRNPQEALGHGSWGMEDYIEAQLRATDIVREIAGTDDLNLLGACAGGLSSTLMLGHLAALGDHRVHAIGFVVTMVDTRYPTNIRMMAGPGIRGRLAKDADRGAVYDRSDVARNFALMRADDLIFQYVVNNWLLGDEPPAFDILAWNVDATNLTAAFDRDMLELYSDNRAAPPGGVTVLGTPVDLAKVDCDNLVVAGLTDHITPWKPCYMTSQLLGGDSEVIVTSTGHIQSVVNPPGKPRARYWGGLEPGPDPDEWMAAAPQHEGSWWPVWAEWINARSGPAKNAPRRLGNRSHPPGDPAPGRYVLE
ncbi:MAG: PHA/PHB synthase family protein [Acidimicrobiales bacterium]